MAKLNGITIIQAGVNRCRGAAGKYLYANLTCAAIAAAVPDGINTRIVDMFIQDPDYEDINSQLALITATTTDFPVACDVSKRLRDKGIATVFGGAHAYACPDECEPHFDAVAVGEAEILLEEILEDFKKGRLKSRYVASEYFDLKKSRIPRYDLLMLRKYGYFAIMASKGCAFDCDFCSSRLITGPEFRVKSVEQVVGEIEYLRSLYEKDPLLPSSFCFVDSNLYTNRKYLIELINALIPLKLNPWGLFASVNIAYDDEVLELLSKANCNAIQIGFESVNTLTLKSINKKQNDPQRYGEVVGRLADKGINTYASFMFGFDTDDERVFEETCKAVIENNIVYNSFFTLTPFPGTRLYERLSREGRLLHRDWSKYNMDNAVFRPANMTPEQLEAGVKKARQTVNDPDRITKCLDLFALRSGKKNFLGIGERIILLLLYLFTFSSLKPHTKKFLRKAVAGKVKATLQDITVIISGMQN